ncbi:MAG TPA: PRC-barrel domain-containing protein [Rubrobacter sp.]|jgi:sporulation protein YlmC with PRC-barrel domain|nr:PRC-barrel domain-containing protein [Rubrobacter sp.]
MERANHRPDNPYTQLEGYRVNDASGEEVGEIENTVYDAPSDVLKYVVVRGHPIPAERIEVDAADQRVSVPYDARTIESAPQMEEISGPFDEAIHEHYESRA